MLVYAGAAALVGYFVTLVLYRLFLHPLAAFPGPKLAAATLWYEFFYDGIRRGQYTFKIQEMHEKHGPIVRISPNELHCNDPAFIDTLYAGGSARRDKYDYFASQFGVFGTVHHNLHRLRRGAMNRFFSKASVTKLEPTIHDKIDKLYHQLCTHMGDEAPVELNMAFSCFTTDVVTTYAFAKCYDFLDDASFQSNFHEPIVAGTNLGPYIKQFPFIYPLMRCLPDSWVTALNPEMGIFLQFQRDVKAQIREIQNQKGTGKERAKDHNLHATIFHELLESDLPESEKAAVRLWQEGQIIVGAGTETTAWTLSVIFFYVLNDRNVYDTLMKELEHALPDPASRPSCSDLEKLPYLISLRLSYGVSTRLQRVSPDGPMLYRPSDAVSATKLEYVIPRGVPVGMTSVLVHHNPKLFPRSTEFDPKRWLDSEGKRDRSLEKYILSFSKGSRQCVGINLAYAELFMVVGLILRRLGPRLRLYETGLDDVEILHDLFVPIPKLDTKGIRVRII
ncbi:putative cytochrome P450 [Hypoxylon rubiginosum]|uniref:Cytochrome P450 n=1 Tax=Hypoxylon rubiginosum TaxID=110542 RepID=A0ACC0DFL1_9PEZI|nr:putative cytochrome P450 [Hypoxylon rubiginosum]